MITKLARDIKAKLASGRGETQRPRLDDGLTLSKLARAFPAFKVELVNQDAIAVELKLEELATAEGLANRPARDASAPDVAERQIETFHRSLLDGLTAATQDAMAAEAVTQQRTAHGSSPHRVHELVDKAAEAYHSGIARLRAPRAERARAKTVAAQHKRAFKQRHRLQREASYPASAALQIAFVAAAGVVEAILNAGLFAEASNAGVVGGFLVAASVAVVNILGSYAVGASFRGINTTGRLRYAAVFGAAAWAVLLPTFHLTAGHLRSALTGPSPDTAFTAAITALVTNPLGIQNAQSWLLVLIGVGAAIFAFHAGYSADDPFPGYGRVDRRANQAAAAHTAIKNDHVTMILAVHEACLADVEPCLHAALDALEQKQVSFATARQILTVSRRGYDAITESYAGLVRRYRHINSTIRTAPAPAYFAEPPRPLAPGPAPIHVADVPSAEEAALDARKAAAELRDTAVEVKRRLRADLQARLEAFGQNIDDDDKGGQ